jgi:hypothetical protein
MRLSLAWFSVRRLMIVVAVIAALVWAGMECVGLWERARHYNSLAATYATMQRWAQEEAARKQARIAGSAGHPEDPRQERWAKELSRSREQSAYWSTLSNKYGHLSSHPWEPLTPDPPPVADFPMHPPPGSE